jgi:uncharacterized protein (DUF58 family)
MTDSSSAIRHPPSAIPFEFNGVVRFTKIGATYLVFTMVIAVAALNTGNNALYIGVALMLGCLLLSGIASKGGLKHLEIVVESMDEVWAGRPANGLLRVRNRSRIWNVRDVVITAPELAEPVLIPMIKRRAELQTVAAFLFRRRGMVQLTAFDAYTRYPFGFFLKKRRLRLTGEIVVFPRISGEEGPRDQYRPLTGEQSAANRPGHGTELHSFREYVPGDSLRHVAWKKSASLGRWIMKQTDLETARVVHVVVDTYKPRAASEDDFEEMISDAASFIHDAIGRGLDVVLSLPRTSLRAREAQSATPLFRALALVEPVYESVHQTLERNSVLFSVRRSDDAKSA